KESHVQSSCQICLNAALTKQKRKQAMKVNIEVIGRVLSIVLLLGCVSFWFGQLLAMFCRDRLLVLRETVLGLFALALALVTAKLIFKSWLYVFITLPVSTVEVLYGALNFILLDNK
ncbi:MAG: hypothetical protein AAGL92_11475, partial [Pseudomonadota bacterium]